MICLIIMSMTSALTAEPRAVGLAKGVLQGSHSPRSERPTTELAVHEGADLVCFDREPVCTPEAEQLQRQCGRAASRGDSGNLAVPVHPACLPSNQSHPE